MLIFFKKRYIILYIIFTEKGIFKMMKIAVLTGASSGLGKEFLKVLDREGLDEIWIIARREDRLRELAAKATATKLVPLALDITKSEAIETLKSKLESAKPKVIYLVNNAGKGLLSSFDSADMGEISSSVDLNCKALTQVTSTVLDYMPKRSFIINVASIAAFAPTARMAVYGATKAYIVSFSRAIREELRRRKINVTAVCPGPMKTEFLPVAGIKNGASPAFDILPYCDPSKVALGAVKAAKEGKAVYTSRLFFKFYRCLAKLFPHALVIKLSKT